ncbi:phenylalanine--tRNA ligase subunit beta [Candidatus Micrarchaeota archaeon]|nr:MAG: phenylalanine--tRNA ligase subunit beta [Candidatus Micrarchaeota archaeon]
MPNIILNKRKVLDYLGKEISDKELIEKIPMLGTDLSAVTDAEIDVEIFPNRPDMLSEEGFARALSSFLGIRTGLRRYAVKKSDYKSILEKDAVKIRPFVANAVVKGIEVDDYTVKSLMQMQEKLHTTQCRNRKKASIGLYDLDTITFPLTYKAVDSSFKFRPLGYDNEMTVKQILEEHPKGKAYGHLLAGPKYPIWIDSKKQVLSLPPIINSAETAVTEKTKNVFIDVTGTHKQTVEQTLNIVVAQLADMGGEIYEVKVNEISYPKLEPLSMEVDIADANRRLGLKLSGSEMAKLLAMMGHEARVKGDVLEVLYPAYRTDILHPVDLINDISIAYGYDNFKEEIPNVYTMGEESYEEILARKIAEVCVGFSFLECYNYHLTNVDEEFKKMNRKAEKYIELANAKNENYNIIRNSLLPGLMKVLSENKHYEYPQNIFEIGRVVFPDEKSENKAREELHLAVALCHKNADFSSIKAVAEAVARECGKKIDVVEEKDPAFIGGRCAAILLDGKKIGVMGEIHPLVLNNFDIELPVSALEIDIKPLGD